MARRWPMTLVAVGVVLLATAIVLVAAEVWTFPAFLLGGAGLGLVASGATYVVRRQRERRADGLDVPPVPPPSRETLVELEEPVRACPRCGFVGVIPAIRAARTSAIECPRCTFVGTERVFARKQDYAEYVRSLPR